MKGVRRIARGVIPLLVAPAPAAAHPGLAPGPDEVWTSWGFEPGVLLALGAAALLYRSGLRALWGRAGVGRGIRRWQAGCYLGGLIALAAALLSPVDPLGNSLFTAHMVQHLLLVVVAAPLLAAGAPLTVWAWALPRTARRPAGRTLRRLRPLTHPLAAWALHALSLWVWHVPVLYDLAVRHDGVHALEHASFLGTAVLFWWVVLPVGGALRNAPGVAILYVFTFTLQSGVLGALLTLADRPWYAAHRETVVRWGLSPLQDQQLAGAVMWVPGSLAYLAATLALLVALLRAAERRSLRPRPAAPPGATAAPPHGAGVGP